MFSPTTSVLVAAVAFLAAVLLWVRRTPRAGRNAVEWRLLDEGPIPYLDCDCLGVIRQVNSSLCRVLARAPMELLGHCYWEILPGSEPAWAARLEAAAFPSQECELRLPGGGSVFVEVHHNLLRSGRGQTIGVRSALIDVSERVRAARQVAESEQRFRRLADSAPVMIWMSDESGATVYVSETARRFVAAPGAESDAWLEAIHLADVGPVLEARLAEQPYEMEYRILRADDRLRWIYERAIPRRSEDGSGFDGFTGCAIDITERKRGEAALRESEERFRLLVDGVCEYAIFLLDVDGTIASWNGGAQRSFGYAPGEIVGRPFSALFSVEDAESGLPRQTLLRASLAGRLEDEGWRLKQSGERFWASGLVAAVDGGESGPKGFACVLRDVTQARVADERLRMLESVVVNATEGVVIVAPQTGGELPVIYVNEAFARMMGVPPAAVCGRELDLGGAAPGKAAFEQARRSGAHSSAEFRAETPGGPIWLEMDVVPVCDQGGAVARLAGIVRDVTARRQAEEQARSSAAELAARNEELNQALALARESTELKSRFLANMSHEIRTPMNGVIGLLELMRATALDNEQRGYLDQAQASASSLLLLINDILDLSRIESGRIELEKVDFSPASVLGEVARVAGVTAGRKRLAIHLDIDPAVPERISGDPLRFRQILTNLVSNAIKFTHAGEVRVRLSAEPAADHEIRLRADIHDTGVGIPAAELGHLFERFRQADSSTTRRYGGSGLGLAITKQLIELMGGTIGVESTVGAGSHFWFTVQVGGAVQPAVATARPVPAIVEPAPLAASARSSPRVLVVEDNPVNQMVARRMLENNGYRAELADNGVAALRVLETENARFDLILMDVQMPEMDGFEATARIRLFENGSRHTPIIAMTANAMSGDRERCLAAGMDDYLSKPLTMKALHEKVSRWTAAPAQSIPA